MKIVAVLAVLGVLILSGCPDVIPGDEEPVLGDGVPHKVSITGARGAFLTAGDAVASIRGVVSATAGTLGIINSTGVPQTAEFVDDAEQTVQVTITKAAQLTDIHLLLSYSYAAGSGTASLNLQTGALADLQVVPSNWDRIATHGATAYYVSAGSLYSADLTDGSAAVLSAGATTWEHYYSSPATQTGSDVWLSRTWIYADASGNVYALYAMSNQHFQAVAFPAAGGEIDFGDNDDAYDFGTSMPEDSLANGTWAVVDPATDAVYLVKGDDMWDNNPMTIGGLELTGHVVQVFAITIDVTAAGVFDIPTFPILAAVATDGNIVTTFVNSGNWGVFTNGASTFAFEGDPMSFVRCDTSSVPVQTGQYPYQITNWVYSDGVLYAGPTETSATVSAITLSDPVVVSALATGVADWSVVAGVLFWSDGATTWQAGVDAGTLGPASVYDGPVPVPVVR